MDLSDDDVRVHSEEIVPSDGSDQSVQRYLFPVDGEHSGEILPIVCDLIAGTEAELFIAYPVTESDEPSPTMPDPEREARREVAQFVLEANQQCQSDAPIQQVVQTGEEREEILQDIVTAYDISTLISEARPLSGIHSLLGTEGYADAAVMMDCDTILVTRIDQLESIESILVPVDRGPHSGMAIETGLALARQHAATLELLHVYDPNDDDGRSKGEEVMMNALKRSDEYEHAKTVLEEADDISQGIIDYTNSFDITVLGAPRKGLLQQFVLGTIPEEVSVKGKGTVLTVHRGGADESWLDRWL